MPRGRKILLGLICVIFGVYACVRLAFPTTTISYRLTLEAATPDGPKTGSGVIQVSYSSEINVNGGGRKGSISLTGEAIYLDLGQGKNLFATLTNDGSGREAKSSALEGALDAKWLPVRVFGFKWDWGNEQELAWQVRTAKAAGLKEVPLIALPTMVTFSDLTDPKSVKLIDPNDIAAEYGEGYALKKATLEISNSPATEGIEGILRWLPELKKRGTALDETNFPGPNDPIASRLGYLSFKNWGL